MNCIGQPLFGWIVGFAFVGLLWWYELGIGMWRKWQQERTTKRGNP